MKLKRRRLQQARAKSRQPSALPTNTSRSMSCHHLLSFIFALVISLKLTSLVASQLTIEQHVSGHIEAISSRPPMKAQRMSIKDNVILQQQANLINDRPTPSTLTQPRLTGAASYSSSSSSPAPPAHIQFINKFAILGNSTSAGQHRTNQPVAPHYSSNLIKSYQKQQLLLHGNNKQHGQHGHMQLTSEQTTRTATSLLDKICIGTSNGLSMHNESDHYQQLMKRYMNCTYVIGNLEITWLNQHELGSDSNLNFLESIREITGYLLIAHVDVDKIRMPNLQIIRGRDYFTFGQTKENFAMILIENKMRQLELPNLREILAGSVGSFDNQNLCHIRTINWDEIINWPTYKSVFVYDGTEPVCPRCHSSCQDSCWGEGAEMCQKFSKISCSSACGKTRCFGPSQNECCHSYCAGGCTGSNQTDCLACKSFYDDGTCIDECPSMMRYNPSKFSWEPNPLGKYAFGATCVRECPENMLRDSGACVRTCPPNKRSVNGECVPCGGPCPKNCQGVEVVHSGNIDQLINCTVIEGSITILDESFSGYTELTTASASIVSAANTSSVLLSSISTNSNNTIRHKPMHPSRLEVFKTLREITGYLNIRARHADFKDLSYFTNLKTIGGRQTTDMFHALSITRTSLVSLNLRSLRKVRTGKITIEENPELCFADTIDWRQIDIRNSEDVTIRNNAPGERCRALGLQCNEQCARDGCWGPGPDECLSCNNYKVDDYCVSNCSSTEPLLGFLSYEEPGQARTCKRCHPECRDGCLGTEARHCNRCRNVKDGPFCVHECPSHKYNNNGTCEECDKSCGPDSCTGPLNRLGEGGCNSCARAVIKPVSLSAISSSSSTSPVAYSMAMIEMTNQSGAPAYEIECIRAEEPCPDGYYQEYVLGTAASQSEGSRAATSGRPVCRKCHHRCKRCIGMGTHRTVCECAKYAAGEQCEDFCPRDYFADEKTSQCVKCSPECNGCFGPTEADCLSCRVYRIYYEDTIATASAAVGMSQTDNGQSQQSRLRFNCTAQCPADKPHRISESNMLDPYCSDYPGGFHDHIESSLIVSLGSSALLLMLVVVLAALMVCLSVYRFHQEKDKKFKLTMHLSGIEDVEPLTPSNMKPNLAPLRSIKETELRKGRQLGSGFGGTVYQGFWYPEGQEQHRPRPVAIKVLRDNGESNMNKEFLDEAYIMASVNHPNLVRLLAVCMTPSHLMLVTQLMPLGCLLDYVKKNRQDIGSKNLLEWGKQIARGMAYLEENRMVHRDLALRNVLLQTPGRALISDFGLAKFLEKDQSEYQSGEGRLPIKWLAPECFRKRKFTHKSDVWAFGVTVWELVTFGQRPFEEYETKDVPFAIEKGARLQQPGHVSAEVYKVMYACWFINPDERPNFRQLTQSFVNFARDPERFIICGTKGIELCKLTTNDEDNVYDEDDFTPANSDEDPVLTNSPTTTTSFSQQATPTTLTHQPELTPSTHNRINEIFGFELLGHHHHSHKRHHHHHHHHHPIAAGDDDDALIDANNNNSLVTNNNNSNKNNNSCGQATTERVKNSVTSCWSMQSTDQRSEQPTDVYDYLLPSPCTEDKSWLTIPRNVGTNPPLSASIINSNVTNEEYFLTHANYVNNQAGIGSEYNYRLNHLSHRLSTSSGDIPQSLV